MSRTDLVRFTADLHNVPGLAEEFSSLGLDPGAWVRRASTKGYHLTSEEAEGLSSSYGGLSDDDLQSVASGWTQPPWPPVDPPFRRS
ncbi:MAG: hypothetical protein GY856_41145 [bacterium]|nr:hypothetical protein [bacterium]